MKEKIKKLLRSSIKEDTLIGAYLLIENYDPQEFLENWLKEDKSIKNTNVSSENRPILDFPFTALNTPYYYKYSISQFLLVSPSQIAICWKPYSLGTEIIYHEK